MGGAYPPREEPMSNRTRKVERIERDKHQNRFITHVSIEVTTCRNRRKPSALKKHKRKMQKESRRKNRA